MDFGYRAQLPSNVTQRIVPRQPGVGAAIADGVRQIGQAGVRISDQNNQVDAQIQASEERIVLREQQRRRDVQIADAAVRRAQLEIDLSSEIEDMRNDAAVGATGHAEAARARINERYEEFLNSLPDDPEVRNRFAPAIASATARAVIREQSWESATRSRFLGESYSEWLDKSASGLFSDPTGERWNEMLTEGDAVIEGLDLDETTKAIMRRDLRARATQAQFGGLLEAGRTDVVRDAIDSGNLDSILSDEDKRDWLRLSRASDRTAQAQADALQREQQAALLDEAKVFEQRVQTGREVPTAAEVRDLMQRMASAGVDRSDIESFAFMAEDAIVSAGLTSRTTRQLETERARIQRRVDAGQSTAADRRAIGLIDGQLEARTEDAASDLGKGWRSDAIEDRIGALDQAASLPPADRLRASARIGNGFQLLSAMPKAQRDMAVRGAAQRAGNPDRYLPPATAGESNRSRIVRAHLEQYLGQLAIDNGAHLEDIMDTALDMMAGYRSANGRETGWDEGDFNAAVQNIFGATRRDGKLQGGIGTVGRFRVELPNRMTADEFEAMLRRQSFEGASYASGEPARPEDVIDHYRPRFASDDAHAYYYVMQGPDGVLLDGEGMVFQLRVPKRMAFSAPDLPSQRTWEFVPGTGN